MPLKGKGNLKKEKLKNKKIMKRIKRMKNGTKS